MFSAPPPLAPGLNGLNGEPAGELATALGLRAIRMLGAMGGTGIPGKDPFWIQAGVQNVTTQAGGIWTVVFPAPFPKECIAAISLTSLPSVKWLGQNATSASFQRGDGAAGSFTHVWFAVGC